MRLAARITTVLVAGVLILIFIAQFVLLQRENEEMERDMRVDALKLGTTISRIVDRLWESSGQSTARRTIDEINELPNTPRVRIVFFDVQRGDVDAPTDPEIAYTALNEVRSAHFRDGNGLEHLCTYSRLTFEARPAAIELSEPIEHPQKNSLYFVLHAMILMGATTLLGAVIVVAIGGAWVGRPLRSLIQKTRRIGEGDLTGPLELRRNDEFGELAVAINSMCEQLKGAQGKIEAEATARIAALDQLRHADRLRTVGRLAAGIAHELGTPLNVVSGRAALIGSGRLSDDDVRKSATIIKSEADRIAAIIRQLLDFARRNTPQRKAVDLPKLVQQTAQLLAPISEKRNSSVEIVEAPESLLLKVDSGQIQQVLTNLIVNAVESMPHGGHVEVSIAQVTATPPEERDGQPGEYARIAVCDRGEGISSEIMEQIFEPFFTTKAVGDGTGLGLSIAYGMVQEHGGWIDVSSEVGRGSCFTVYLPLEVAACKEES